MQQSNIDCSSTVVFERRIDLGDKYCDMLPETNLKLESNHYESSLASSGSQQNAEQVHSIQSNNVCKDDNESILKKSSVYTKEGRNLRKRRQKKEVIAFQIRQDINPMIEVEKMQERISIIKGHLPFRRMCFLGCLAGWWLGIGVILAVTIAGGIPVEIRAAWPMLPRFIHTAYPCLAYEHMYSLFCWSLD